MRTTLRTSLALVATVILIASGIALADDPATTLNGEYVWSGPGAKGGLEAVFTKTGDNTWSVDFNFTFRGKDHTYSGSAEGSLTDGKLAGTVQNESKARTFTFEGAFADGKFSGTHAETTGGEPIDTGTITLSR